jgi:hypothetical protein
MKLLQKKKTLGKNCNNQFSSEGLWWEEGRQTTNNWGRDTEIKRNGGNAYEESIFSRKENRTRNCHTRKNGTENKRAAIRL